MATVRFNLKRASGKRSAVVAICRHKGKSMKLKTGISVEVKKWDPKKQRIKPAWREAEQINQALEKFRDKILSIILKIGRLPAKTDLAPDGAGILKAYTTRKGLKETVYEFEVIRSADGLEIGEAGSEQGVLF